jgi:glycosyltransferase involved in cell wall biosynthesis
VIRIAYFSPLPPAISGIADYSAELLPHLAQHIAVTLFVNPGETVAPALAQQFPIFPIAAYPQEQRKAPFDAALYHVGNDFRFHGAIYEMLLHEPGIVVLHEVVLHHAVAGFYLENDDPGGYIDLMRQIYGPMGEAVAMQVMEKGTDMDFTHFPLVESALCSSRAVIVHNQYAARAVAHHRPGLPVAVIPHHLSLPLPAGLSHDSDGQSAGRDAIRRALGLEGRFVVSSFGFVTPAKRPAVVLRAFARFQRYRPNAVCCLVGQITPGIDLATLIDVLSLPGDAVRITGRVELDEFMRYMLATDVAVNLRYPTCGETSGCVMRLLGLGIPTLVSDVGGFSELPDDACAKIPIGPWEEETLVAFLNALVSDPKLRQAMGANARRHIQTHHTLAGSARAYTDFIERVVVGEAAPVVEPIVSPLPAILAGIGATLAGWGITEHDDALLHPIAQTLIDLGLDSKPSHQSSVISGHKPVTDH